MTEGDTAIACRAVFYRATTTIDGGWRVSFDLSDDESDRVSRLSVLRGEVLFLTVIPERDVPIPEDET